MISPNSFGGFVFTRAIDMDLDSPIPNPAKSLGNNDKNTILFINRKVLGARKLLLKHIYLILFNNLDHI
jgi:hypothetical protein